MGSFCRASAFAVLAIGATLAVSACDGSERSATWGGTVVDSAGVQIVLNPEVGLWSTENRWRVREELRIGSFGEDPDYQFAQVGSIALTERGHLLVVDRQTREIREFTGSGEFVRSFGEPGQGPGEFGQGVADVLVVRGDTVLVPDPRSQRIHRFGPDGRFLDASRLDAAARRALSFQWSPASATGVGQFRPNRVPEPGDPPLLDTLRVIEPSGELGAALLSFPAGGLIGQGGTLRYFTPEPTWTVTDSLTVIYAINDAYRIQVYDRSGSLRRIVTRPHEPRPISDRDIRAFFAYLDRAWLAAGVLPSRLEENHRRVSFAEYFPAFYQAREGPDGTLWVQPVRAPGDMSDEEIELYNFIEDFGASDWEVFDRDGRYLGVVSMPPRVQPRLFAGDAIYGVARDALDVQYVVRLRIEKGTAGSAEPN